MEHVWVFHSLVQLKQYHSLLLKITGRFSYIGHAASTKHNIYVSNVFPLFIEGIQYDSTNFFVEVFFFNCRPQVVRVLITSWQITSFILRYKEEEENHVIVRSNKFSLMKKKIVHVIMHRCLYLSFDFLETRSKLLLAPFSLHALRA